MRNRQPEFVYDTKISSYFCRNWCLFHRCDEEEVPEKPKVSNTWKTKAEAAEYCGLIANKTGPFGRCIAAADQKKLMAYFSGKFIIF